MKKLEIDVLDDCEALKTAFNDPLSPHSASEHAKLKLAECKIQADERCNEIEEKRVENERSLVGVISSQQSTINTLANKVANNNLKTPSKKDSAPLTTITPRNNATPCWAHISQKVMMTPRGRGCHTDLKVDTTATGSASPKKKTPNKAGSRRLKDFASKVFPIEVQMRCSPCCCYVLPQTDRLSNVCPPHVSPQDTTR